MRFWAPAKCTSAGAQTDTLSQNKCVYRGSQNALRHLAQKNALRRQCFQIEQILRMRVVGPTPETDCGETCWSDQLGDSTTVFPKRWTFQSPKLVQGGRIIAISNPSKFCYDLEETGKCVFGRLQNALLQAPKRTLDFSVLKWFGCFIYIFVADPSVL